MQAKVIVGADGTISHIAKWMGLLRLLTPQNLCPVKHHRIRDVDVDPWVIEKFLGREYAPDAYAWIIPVST